MLDHVGFMVSDHERAAAFYDALLAPLGTRRLVDVTAEQTGAGAHSGYGSEDRPFFWIGTGTTTSGPMHIAFAVDSRDAVRAFHEAGLKSGGGDNGAPGLRPHYHPDYYAAFVLDADGNNIEAVCHRPV